MKLIVYNTPSHDALAERLLASDIGEYQLAHVRGPQIGKGLYGQKGFHVATIEKLRAIRREATEDFLYADADIVFLKPSLEVVEIELAGYDCLFQDDGGALCSGLFAMRHNQACLALLDRWIAELEKNFADDSQDDQSILNDLYLPKDVKIGKLSRRFANPFTIIGKHWYGEEIELDKDVVIFHANWTFGLERKLELIDRIWNSRNKEHSHV